LCGLVGVYGDVGKKEAAVFKWLLKFDELRGPHSTGVLRVKDDNDLYIYKNVGGVDKFFAAHPAFDEELDEAKNLSLLMGHNRWATQGEINIDNAHPFEFDNLVGAHNGTIPAHGLRRIPGHEKFTVDSKAIYNYISETNISDLWKLTDGAMALTWYDKVSQTFNIARNKERTLFYIRSSDNMSLYWASEAWMLDVLLGKFGIKTRDKSPVSVPINTHIKFSLTNMGQIVIQEEPLNPFVWVNPYPQQQNWLSKKEETSTVDDANTETIEMVEFHKQGPEDYDGWFFAKTSSGKEVRVTIDSSFEEMKKERFDSINAEYILGNKKYLAKKGAFWTVKGMSTVHYTNLTKVIPQTNVRALNTPYFKKDRKGYECSVSEFNYFSTGGCVGCSEPLQFIKLGNYTVYAEMNSVLCEKCSVNHDKIDEMEELMSFGLGGMYYAN